MPRLAGKTAIVTGGAKGIGRHYSQALAAEGARVMIADIADGRGLAEEIAGRHGANSVASVTFDIGDENAVKGLVAETIKRFGQIDVLVNNAALYSVLKPRAFNEWDPELWDRVMAINVRGTYLMVRHVAPHMMERRSGKIINIGSGDALQRRAAHAALRDVQGRDPCVHPRAVARARRIRYRGQFAFARLHPERHRAREYEDMSRKSAFRCGTAAPSSATRTRKTCSARSYFSRRATAIS